MSNQVKYTGFAVDEDGDCTAKSFVGDIAGDVTGDVTGNVTGYVIFPTSDPLVAGAWWDNAGTLTKSTGS